MFGGFIYFGNYQKSMGKIRIAFLVYWDQLGWGKHINDSGKKADKATIGALEPGGRNRQYKRRVYGCNQARLIFYMEY